MSSNTSKTQLAQVGNGLNRLLRRIGLINEPSLSLNAKIKRTYPKNA